MKAIDGMLLTGRVLMAVSFVPSAVGHVSNISGFAAALASKGLPYTNAAAALIVLAELFGPAALALGLAPRIAASLLIGATLSTTLTLHRFWEFSGAARAAEQTLFIAQGGILAGLLFFLASGPGGLSWQTWWAASGEKRKPSPKKKTSRPRSPRPKPAPQRFDDEEEMADAA